MKFYSTEIKLMKKNLKLNVYFPDSPYRTPISGAILQLQEKGVLQDLKKKWWQERGGGKCASTDTEATNSSELGLANVGGVFLVLLIGCSGSFAIAICEFLWNVRKVAVTEKVSSHNLFQYKLLSHLIIIHLNLMMNFSSSFIH